MTHLFKTFVVSWDFAVPDKLNLRLMRDSLEIGMED
jgi:hypothetical protein